MATAQTLIVVGAGSGIGAGVAEFLAHRGFFVACLDRDFAGASATAAAISATGGEAIGIAADVTDALSIEAAFSSVDELRGQIHAVINTAGVQGQLGVRSHDVSLDDVDRVYAVNLRGALAVSQAAITRMLPHGYGRIAHVASIAGKEGNPGMIAYSTTKAGLIGMVKAQGKEYARDGITINALAPAVIQTPFLDTQPADVIAYMTEKIPMGRTGTVTEVAEMLAWMVSPACSFTTGFAFDLSGGRATY